MLRRSRFHEPNPRTVNQTIRYAIVEPTGGLNTSVAATRLKPNESPAMLNFDIVDGWLQPRSGISQYGANAAMIMKAQPVVALFNTNVKTGPAGTMCGLFAFSNNTVMCKTIDPDTSWVTSSGPLLSGWAAQQENNFYSITQAKDSGGSAVVFFSQGPERSIMYHYITPFGDTQSYATLTSFHTSGYSGGHMVLGFDDRLLVFKSIESSGALRFTRLTWTAKGNPFNFANGGFQDIVGMRGEGTQLLAEENRAVLFSIADVWQATPRGDAYAFDFTPIDHNTGCPYPRTAVTTPIGIIWVGNNLRLHLLQNNQVYLLGRKIWRVLEQELGSTILSGGAAMRSLFAAYDAGSNSYTLFYNHNDSVALNAKRALKLNLNTIIAAGTDEVDGIWTRHEWVDHAFQSAACAPNDSGRDSAVTNSTQDYYGGWQNLLLGGSAGTTYLQTPLEVTDDDGTGIETYWRSRPLPNRDTWQYEAINDVFVDSISNQTSSASLWATNDFGATLISGTSFSVLSGTGSNHAPVTFPAGRNTQLELRTDMNARPRIGAMQIAFRTYTGRHSG